MKKYIYAIPSLLIIMYISFIGVHVFSNYQISDKNVMFASILVIIPFMIYLYQVVRCVLDALRHKKYLWIPLLVIFGFIFMPYYGIKYEQDRIVLKNTIITYAVAFIFLSSIAILYAITLVGKRDNLVLVTNDDKVEFTFSKGWKEKKTDYSVYALNDDKKLAFGVLTYDLSEFETYTIDDILDDQKRFLDSKLGITLEKYSDKIQFAMDDKSITSLEYIAKSESKEHTIYRLSVISFDKKNQYVVYTFGAVLEKDYEKYGNDLLDIIKSTKKRN